MPLPKRAKPRSKRRQARQAPAGASQITPAAFAAARERLGLTQQQLAEALGYDRRHIGSYERGHAQIPPVVVHALVGLEATRSAGMFAVYDERAIYGLGSTAIAAVFDALEVGFGPLVMMDERFSRVRKMTIAEITPRLADAIDRQGGDLKFTTLPDGRLDLP